MRELALKDFRAVFPHCPPRTAEEQLPLLNATMRQYAINNKLRIAAFCATLAVESGEFRYRSELASGRAYEGRRDLGNVQPGDGVAFKGHGRIQITGRHNHTAYARYIKKSGHVTNLDFSRPSLAHRLAEDPYALDSSGWFWSVLHDLNSLADRGDFLSTQVKVNGRNRLTRRPNHWKERNGYYQRALQILPDDIGFADEPAPVAPVVDVEVDAVAAQLPQQSTTATVPPTATASVLDNGIVNSTVAGVDAKQAGKTILKTAAVRLGRPAALLIGALEAGNVFAWLGVGVAVAGIGVLIYLEREELKRGARWLVARLKK